MKKIDCLGEMCPIPVIKLKKELNYLKKGAELLIVVDQGCSLNYIEDFCQAHHLSFSSEEVMNSVWEITIISK